VLLQRLHALSAAAFFIAENRGTDRQQLLAVAAHTQY